MPSTFAAHTGLLTQPAPTAHGPTSPSRNRNHDGEKHRDLSPHGPVEPPEKSASSSPSRAPVLTGETWPEGDFMISADGAGSMAR
jgi:hypothetical protein